MAEAPEPTPTEAALNTIAALVAAKTQPARMAEAIGTVVASWANEPDMGPAQAQQRIERLWDSLSKDASDLQEQIADAQGGETKALADATRILDAMNAAIETLAAAHERL